MATSRPRAAHMQRLVLTDSLRVREERHAAPVRSTYHTPAVRKVKSIPQRTEEGKDLASSISDAMAAFKG